MRAGGVVLIVCVFVALAASTGKGAAKQVPCSLSTHRLQSGRALSLSVLCTTDGVEMLRVDFPSTVRLVSQTSLKGGVCRDSTTRTWFCVFPSGEPVALNSPVTGMVRFQATAPRAAQHGRVTYYLQAPGGPAGPGSIDAAMTGTASFSY